MPRDLKTPPRVAGRRRRADAADVPTPSQSVVDEALRITSGSRQEAYGHPADNHGATAMAWTAYLQRKGDRPLDAEDVCMMQVLLKVIRHAHRRKRDNLVDIVGYTLNAVEIAARRDA